MMPSNMKKALRLMVDDCAKISVAAIIVQHNIVSLLDKLDVFGVNDVDVQDFVAALNAFGDYLSDFCKHSEPFQGGNK